MLTAFHHELNKFDEKDPRPFRVAVSDGHQPYEYAGHTEPNNYADHTIGYAYSFFEAFQLLKEARMEANKRVNEFWDERSQSF